MINYKKFLLEGKKEQDKINELLDKGNLSNKEKELLQRLIKGGKLEDEPKPKQPIPMVVKKVKFGGSNLKFPPNFKDIDVSKTDNLISLKSSRTFKKGDKVVYENEKSKNNGKTGTVIEIREDGRIIISFDGDGHKLAANPKNINIVRKGDIKNRKPIDPITFDDDYTRGERDWYNQVQPPNYEDGDEGDNNPNNIYFCILPSIVFGFDDDGLNIILTPINYWVQNGACWDGTYGENIYELLDGLEVYEIAESMFEYYGGKTAQILRRDIEKLGFVWSDDLYEFMMNHG